MTTPRIGYGAMRLTGPGHWGDYPDRESGVKLLRQVADAGVTLIDTADVYGPHTNEQLIRDALHPYPAHLRIATKGGFVRSGPEISTIAALGHRQYLRQSAKLSARRLGVERLDLYYLHSGWARDASFEEQVGTLPELRDEGVIGDVGLSNVTLEQLRTAQGIVEVAAVTAHYNVADRHEQPLLDAATEAGAVFVPWQPVSLSVPGAPTDTAGPDAVRRVLEPIAARHGATVSQVALAWLLGRSPAVLPIPGTTSIAHVRENLAAADLALSPKDHTTITRLGGRECLGGF
ncbi:aldo/keto reductase [Amycolatopsis sp. cmx-8-4]|uniref:aldo/keto reductase n=1 Tax=Amycolatopsis sp. cmx-8-4 TaxID=2790947 RepID=UPI00397B9FA4